MKLIRLAPFALVGLSTAVFAGQSLYRHPTPHDPVSPDLMTRALPAAGGQSSPSNNRDEMLITQLSAKVPAEPTFADRETIDLMREVAKTRREDAARLLVKCLAFNLDPLNVDEERSDATSIPAIQFLQEYFGQSASKALYEEGVATDKVWLQNRIALAMRTILPPDSVRKVKERVAADIALRPNAWGLGNALSNEQPDVQLNAPRKKRDKEIDRAIKSALERNSKKKP